MAKKSLFIKGETITQLSALAQEIENKKYLFYYGRPMLWDVVISQPLSRIMRDIAVGCYAYALPAK